MDLSQKKSFYLISSMFLVFMSVKAEFIPANITFRFYVIVKYLWNISESNFLIFFCFA